MTLKMEQLYNRFEKRNNQNEERYTRILKVLTEHIQKQQENQNDQTISLN